MRVNGKLVKVHDCFSLIHSFVYNFCGQLVWNLNVFFYPTHKAKSNRNPLIEWMHTERSESMFAHISQNAQQCVHHLPYVCVIMFAGCCTFTWNVIVCCLTFSCACLDGCFCCCCYCFCVLCYFVFHCIVPHLNHVILVCYYCRCT